MSISEVYNMDLEEFNTRKELGINDLVVGVGKGLIYSKQLAMFEKPQVIGYSKGSIYVMEIDKEKANNVIKKIIIAIRFIMGHTYI